MNLLAFSESSATFPKGERQTRYFESILYAQLTHHAEAMLTEAEADLIQHGH